jgi:hypothetical protein
MKRHFPALLPLLLPTCDLAVLSLLLFHDLFRSLHLGLKFARDYSDPELSFYPFYVLICLTPYPSLSKSLITNLAVLSL